MRRASDGGRLVKLGFAAGSIDDRLDGLAPGADAGWHRGGPRRARGDHMATEPADQNIMTRRVRYGNSIDAFLAAPARAGQHRTVILLHERYGLVQHTTDLARK